MKIWQRNFDKIHFEKNDLFFYVLSSHLPIFIEKDFCQYFTTNSRLPLYQWSSIYNSHSMVNIFSYNSIHDHQITTNICTCHDSRVAMTYTKYSSENILRIGMRAKGIFYPIWVTMEKAQWDKNRSQFSSGAIKHLDIIPPNYPWCLARNLV